MADFDAGDFTPDPSPAPAPDSAGMGGRMGQQGVPDDLEEYWRRKADELIEQNADVLMGGVPDSDKGRILTPVERAELVVQLTGNMPLTALDMEEAAARYYQKSREAEAKELWDNVRQNNQNLREQMAEKAEAEAEAAAAASKTKSLADMSDDEVPAYAAEHLADYQHAAEDEEARYEREYGPGALQQLKRLRAQGLTEQQALEQISDPAQREAAKRAWQARQDELDYAAAVRSKDADVIRSIEEERALRASGQAARADEVRQDRQTGLADARQLNDAAAAAIAAGAAPPAARDDLERASADDVRIGADNRDLAQTGQSDRWTDDDDDPAPIEVAAVAPPPTPVDAMAPDIEAAATPVPDSRATVDANSLASSREGLGSVASVTALELEAAPDIAVAAADTEVEQDLTAITAVRRPVQGLSGGVSG